MAITQDDTTENKPRRRRGSTAGSKESSGTEIVTLQAQLMEKEAALQAKDTALRQMEESLMGRVRDLEGQVREKDALLLSCEAELRTLRSQADAVMAEMAEIRNEKDRMFLETVKLTSELKEKKLALAKLEKDEWRSIGQRNSLKRRFGKLRKLFSKKDDDEEDPNMNDRFPLTSR
jgi:chromosome segregation ATPase